MRLSDIFFIGVGLSMDAFAVSMCQGVSMKKLRIPHALLIALFFGGFQALMPLLGFALGSTFASAVTIGPWIAFGLLLFIGGKMLIDGIRDKDTEAPDGLASIGRLFVLAVATSIDAFAVGVTFSMQSGMVWLHGGTSIFLAIGLIGVTTFVLSAIGVWLGNRFGLKYHRTATIVGGVVLILIGVKILLESFSVLPDFFRCGTVSVEVIVHTLSV
ncbi:MAG: manganese efflux pump [Clostridia bacterium]|nr:manganese efflux pump [Clostridia bacterium]